MQNYYNDFEYGAGYYDGYAETEEERRKREQELANRAVQTQEIKTYGDGTVEETTKTEYAPAVQQVAMEPVAPVAPVQQMPVAQPVAMPQPVDPAEYNRQIAQQESGSRPDIGFHNQNKSSAYGTYGLTNAAYQDARKLNPNLPADITQATPEQQTAAQNAFTQQNARYLKAYGVEPTQQNLAAAHFLGAKGLSDYMKTGYISPQAAAANGGEENVRRIVNQRLGGEAAPASAAAQPATPAQPTMEQPAADSQYSLATGTAPKLGFVSPPAGAAQQSAQYISNYQAVQDDPMKLLALRGDESAPKFIRERAGEQAFELMNKEVQQKTAERQAQQLAAAAATGDRKASNTIARELQNQEGSWLKMILLGFIDPKLAGEEAVKLGIGNKWATTTDADGKPAMIQVNAKGLPLKGYTADGNEIATKDLVRYAAGGKQRELDIVGGTYVNDKTGEVGRVISDKRTGQSFIQTDTGRKPMTGFRPQSSGGTLEQQAAAQQQKLGINLVYEPAIAAASKGAATLAEFNAMNGTNFAIAGRDSLGMPLLVDQASGQILTRPAGAAPAGGAIPPTSMPAGAAAGTMPAAPGAPAAMPAGQTPTSVAMGTEFTKGQQEQFIKYVADDVQPKAEAGSQISRIRKEQIQGPDGILNNAELAGILQGQGGKGSEAANIMRDLITGNFKDEADLSRRVASLSLNQRQKDVLYRQIGLNLQVAPLTLKANAGPGAVSDAEQKANREANVDITRQPLYSGLSLLTRDQFQKDLNVAKNDFRSGRADIRSTDQLNKAWSAEKKKAETAYDGIYRARAQYIAKYNPDGTNTRAVVDAFKYYPVPEWTGTGWDYKTEYAKKAARPSLDSFNR